MPNNKTKKPQKIGSQKVTDKKTIAEEIEKKRNVTWDNNQSLLQEAYVNLIQKLKRCPTRTEVAKEVNLSVKTVKLHIKEMKFEPLDSPLRVLTPDVLASIYSSARKGSAQSQKLWLQIMEGWTEKQEMNISGGVKIIKDDI